MIPATCMNFSCILLQYFVPLSKAKQSDMVRGKREVHGYKVLLKALNLGMPFFEYDTPSRRGEEKSPWLGLISWPCKDTLYSLIAEMQSH